MLSILFTSCVKDVDFDQVEDVVLTPVLELDFIYSRFDTDQFIEPGIDSSIIIPEVAINDTLNYDLLGTDFVVDNLEQVELTFEFSNTIERDFTFSFGFLNDVGVRIGPSYTIIANAGMGPGTEPIITNEIIILDNATINVLSEATKLVSSIRVFNINSGLEGVLELKSKGTYFINYDL
ncbi:hypothetical protein GCM10022258_06230 [Aquimarina gracilis]